MIVQEISFRAPEENIRYDEELLKRAEDGQGGEVLRFWESPVVFVVLGRMGDTDEDVILDNTTRDNVPVIRRASGGGTVVQGPGCLNYSLILSKTNPDVADLKRSYAYILSRVVQALSQVGVDAEFLPISDIALKANHKKISGNAQKRGRNFILHHGTILYQFDLPLISRYLKTPKDIPKYRQGRSHADFVENLEGDIYVFKKVMIDIWRSAPCK
ncbi:MAG: lipoate--protein ligase family protein [Candidatus Omnitrophica bacterium]|nr:lipoate--protein ligase family protein [Candidatus Omnitrophota bacterium]